MRRLNHCVLLSGLFSLLAPATSCGAAERVVSPSQAACGRLQNASIVPAWISHDYEISGDGSLLATTYSRDKRIAVWDLASGKLLHSLQPATRQVGRYLAFSPDGAILYVSESASAGFVATAWDTRNGKKLADVRAPRGEDFNPDLMAVAHRGRQLALVDKGRHAQHVVLFSLDSQAPPKRLKVETGADIQRLAFSADDSALIGFGVYGTIEAWAVASGAALFHHDLELPKESKKPRRPKRTELDPWGLEELDCPPFLRAITADGSYMAIYDRESHILQIVQSRQKRVVFQRKLPEGSSHHRPGIGCVALSSQADMAAVSMKNGKRIRLLKIPSGEKLGEISMRRSQVHDLQFSDDGRYLVANTGYRVRVWNVATREELPATRGDEAWNQLLFSDDGKTLLVESVHRVSGWDWQAGKRRWSAPRAG